MTTSTESAPDSGETASDKLGSALAEQRFQMLKDIARDLAGDVLFPTSFDAALRLRKALQQQVLSGERLAALIGVEPLLAVRLLQLANGVAHGQPEALVRTLPAAIERLGVELVRSTALGVVTGQLMRAKETAQFSELANALWQHSLKTAAAACVLARSHSRVDADEALLAGLVHDLGAFYMLYRAAQYAELRERPETLKYLIIQWHESIGVSLLSALGLPHDMVSATIDHDQPRGVPESLKTLEDVVYVANIIAGAHFEWLYQDFDPDVGKTGLVRETYADLLPEIDRLAAEMQALFA